MSRFDGENREPVDQEPVIFIVNKLFLRFNTTKIYDLQWVASCFDSRSGLFARDPVIR